MRIAISQINTKVGDLSGNTAKILEYIQKARQNKCDLVVFSELCLVGCPPRDLLLRKDFVKACHKALEDIINASQGIGVLIGTVTSRAGSSQLRNSAILIEDGAITAQTHKSFLNAFNDLEEKRYFESAEESHCMDFRKIRLGISFCREIWDNSSALAELYNEKPDIVINMSARPYVYGTHEGHINNISNIVSKYGIPLIYVNQIGGNDELVFDGSSMVFDKKGRLILHAQSFKEDFLIYNTESLHSPLSKVNEDISWLYKGLVLGMRDYFHKSGFNQTLLGLSGGVDSSLAACIAVDALGKENVMGVSMPSRYSSQHSKEDARILAENLGIDYRVIPIETFFREYIKVFNGGDQIRGDLAEENIQARIRGNLLMFLANREGRMLISAENKSEIAVGYSTLYGDMCGGLSVIGDILKGRVYELCRYVNRQEEIIPERVLTKVPSAELRPGQRDEDSLPPYPVLDAVLRMYVEENIPSEDIIASGYDTETVYQILNMIDRTEYKRRQGAPVIKLTGSNFGMGFRIPMTHGFCWGGKKE